MGRGPVVPALVLGGQANAVAIVRSLGRLGIPVHVAATEDCPAFHSRYCGDRFSYAQEQDAAPHLARLLLDEMPDHLRGSVVFVCSDDAIVFVADHYEALRERLCIPAFVPDLQRAMLDKKRTLELARSAGVPTPGFWELGEVEELEANRDQMTFPVMIKPTHSHLFQRAFGPRKFFTAGSFDELVQRARQVRQLNLDAIVSEIIPGPDSLLCSYFTYMDGAGEHLFHFTKRVIRRQPMNEGQASYHITEWLPEVAELGQRFFHGIGFRGLGNIEFKRDLRDGTLKVIECNARFTAAQWVIVRAGMDISHLIYCRVTGQTVPKIERYRNHVRMLEPLKDYWAFRELQRKGMLTWWGWLRSIMHWQAMPYFTLTDPWPGLVLIARVLRTKLHKMARTATAGVRR